MAVHIFSVDERNYEVCIKKGIVGLPEPNGGKNSNVIFDGLLSRLATIKENDYILMYVIGAKELRGVWQADGVPFYDETPVWADRCYPFRCKIKCSKYTFSNHLNLNDINDLRNNGKLWTWALARASGTNAMFSISNQEFEIILHEFMKINPFSIIKSRINEPYPFHESDLRNNIHTDNAQPKYENSVMTLLNLELSQGAYTDIFGNYSDYLSYVPTNLGREIDILLMFENPLDRLDIISYDIIEVKRDVFDIKALSQLIDYESWFLQKKVLGDLKMLRTTAIAKSFAEDVIEYVKKREVIEKKPIKLLEYSYGDSQKLDLKSIL